MKKGNVEVNTVYQTKNNKIKKALSLFLSIVMLLSITAGLDFSSYAATSNNYEVTCGSGVKLRSSYSTSSSELVSMPKGTKFNVTEKYMSGGYYWGKTTYNGKSGWTALLKTNHSEIYSTCFNYEDACQAHIWIGDSSANSCSAPFSCQTKYYFWGRLTDRYFKSQEVKLFDSMPELAERVHMKFVIETPDRSDPFEYQYSNCCENWYAITTGNSSGLYTGKVIISGVFSGSISCSFTINSYNITFNSNGGNCSTSSKTIAYGSGYGTLPIPTKTGYTFVGWYTSATGGSQISTSTKFTSTSNQTLYAQWNANNYTVNFNANGGSCSTASKTVSYDNNYGVLPTPTKSGYTFDGWYTSASGGTKVTSSSIVNIINNQTLYAHWTLYDTMQSNEVKNISINTAGDIKYLYFTPSVTGNYKFYSLSNSDTYGYIYDSNMNQIIYNDDGGDNQNFLIECHLEANTTYILGVKYYSSSNTGNFDICIKLPVEINFNSNGGTCSVSSQTVNYGDQYGTLPIPTKSGYTFDGWYTSSNGGTKITSSNIVNITSSQTLYAHWSHTHSYNCDITKTPTCTANGEKTYTCTICGDSFATSVQSTGHTVGNSVKENVVEATALTDGSYDEVVYCENCNVQLSSRHITVPKKSISISAGETKTVTIASSGEYVYYSFTPNINGKYKFYSTSSLDTYAYLYDENMNEITRDDDSGEGTNFSLEYNFEAGKTYVFGCRFYSSSNTGSFNVTLEAPHTHSYSRNVTNPTCTSEGYTTYVCSCGDSYTDNYTNATGHTYNSGTITKSAICTEKGTKTYTCQNCGQTKTETISATGHNYSTLTVQPTCTENGYIRHQCQNCNDAYVSNYVAPTGHTAGNPVKENVVEATALTDGSYDEVVYCENCNAQLSNQHIIVPKKSISISAGETKTATIASSGEYVYYSFTPNINGKYKFYSTSSLDTYAYLYDENMNEITHDDDSGEGTNFSLEYNFEAGKTYVFGCRFYSSSNTGSFNVTLEAPHIHSYSENVTNPTCTSGGYTTYVCSCGDSYTDNYTNATEHNYTSEFIGSCTQGFTYHTCKECGYCYMDDSITPPGHSYDSGTITKSVTCTEDGVKTYTCQNCGQIKTETIPAAGHIYNTLTVQPTCTERGYTKHTCIWCGDSYKENYTNATGHNYDYGNVIISPTCTADGVMEYTCSNCNKKESVAIDRIGHDFYVYTVDSTCISDGYVKYECCICGYSYTSDYTNASGHILDNGKITKQPTCAEYGVKSYSCYKCGEIVYTENVSKISHKYTSKTVSPTCTSRGYTLYTCSYCGDSYVTNYTSSTGHYWNNGKITKQPTCTTNGLKTYNCYNCSQTKTETIQATGHTYIISEIIPSTCTSEGYTNHTCTKCGYSYYSDFTDIKAHTYKTITTKATVSKNGSVVTRCSDCGSISKNTPIYYPKTITLSKTSYVYNGKAQKPSVTVKDSNGKTIASSNYTVTYSSGRKNVGQYTVTIKFKGNYSGTVKKTFTIVPKSVEFSSIKPSKNGIVKFTWKKGTNITGYEMQVSTKSSFAKNNTKTLSFKSSKTSTTGRLVSKKKYYVRIRTYKTVNGIKYYSSWSKTKTVKTK